MNDILVCATSAPTAFVVQLNGEVDLSSVLDTGERLLAACRRLPPPHSVVLDLSAITFFSVAGLRAVRAFAAVMAGREIDVVIVAPRDGLAYRLLTRLTPQEAAASFPSVSAALSN
ncbi:STAS domain-containing protein [Nonomuraea sp. NPDC050663]|uniref:STAS domain-containing protein n=1 Tax=Nonomuraea sp. NPDC050663 TaxID=3364370 RepID=UPI0037A4CBB7